MRVSRISYALALAVDAATALVLPPGNECVLPDESLTVLGPLLRAYMKTLSTSLVLACPSCDPPAPGTGHVRVFQDDLPDSLPVLATGEQGLRIDVSISEDGTGLVFNNRTIFPARGIERHQLYQVSKLAHNSLMETPVNLTGWSGGGGREPVSVSETGERTFVKTITIENINMVELLRGMTIDFHFLQKPNGQVRILKVEPVERKGHKRPIANAQLTQSDLQDFGPAPPEDEICSNLPTTERFMCTMRAGGYKSRKPGGTNKQDAASSFDV